MCCRKLICMLLVSIVSCSIYAAEIKVVMNSLTKKSIPLGYIKAKDSRYGLLLIPNLRGLTPGAHGLHLHVNPDCKNAGGHFDPKNTKKHLGPYNDKGHMGDLPLLYVNKDGIARVPELAPRLSLAKIINHSFVIVANGDSYKDDASKNGGGGRPIACGVIRPIFEN